MARKSRLTRVAVKIGTAMGKADRRVQKVARSGTLNPTVSLPLCATQRMRHKSMTFNDNWNRRTFLGTLGALVGTLFSGRRVFALPRAAGNKAAPLSGFGATGNVYEELGVTTVINGQGTMTVLGGSLMRPEVE